MGESLFYSWLRHVKDCQIVQNNWKASPQWNLQNEDALNAFMQNVDRHFSNKMNYSVYKKNSSLTQLLQQGECDVLGISIQDGYNIFYAVDIAFHEGGLQYGSRSETVMKVIAKITRTAMCLWGYMGCTDAEIIFASPKITPAVMHDLEPCFEDINALFSESGLRFRARLIANEVFNSTVLQPILLASDGIADTSELFLRSYQMLNMFAPKQTASSASSKVQSKHISSTSTTASVDESQYKELKIGVLARNVLRRLLEEGKASKEEVLMLQQADYSKATFDLQYPLLAKADSTFEKARYYSTPLVIRNETFYMCSQWFEVPANNDRPYLIQWIESHQ